MNIRVKLETVVFSIAATLISVYIENWLFKAWIQSNYYTNPGLALNVNNNLLVIETALITITLLIWYKVFLYLDERYFSDIKTQSNKKTKKKKSK